MSSPRPPTSTSNPSNDDDNDKDLDEYANRPESDDEDNEDRQDHPSSSSSTSSSSSSVSSSASSTLENITSSLESLQLKPSKSGSSGSDAGQEYIKKKIHELKEKKFDFWGQQPMPSLDSEDPSPDQQGPIEPNRPASEIRQIPYHLVDEVEWSDCDITGNPAHLEDVYTLLRDHYVEDDDNMFRFHYSKEFFVWALTAPGYRKEWHIGVRVKKSQKLIAFISAIPIMIRVYKSTLPMVEINFLCVHKKLRHKRLAPVLIQEITRRVNLTGTFQAMYTAGAVLPKPVGSAQYFHRSLNPKKLVDVRFSHLGKNMTIARSIKIHKLPTTPATPGWRATEEKDIPAVLSLLSKYLEQFCLAQSWSKEQVSHWLLPRPNVIYSFVVENPVSHQVTDFISFYELNSSILNHPRHNLLRAAYSFYYASSTTSIKDLMNDALIVAQSMGFDVFNALDLLDNDQNLLRDLKFAAGDGHLQFYVYNWKTKTMSSNQIGIVLL